jgi:hypothetical protein
MAMRGPGAKICSAGSAQYPFANFVKFFDCMILRLLRIHADSAIGIMGLSAVSNSISLGLLAQSATTSSTVTQIAQSATAKGKVSEGKCRARTALGATAGATKVDSAVSTVNDDHCQAAKVNHKAETVLEKALAH